MNHPKRKSWTALALVCATLAACGGSAENDGVTIPFGGPVRRPP